MIRPTELERKMGRLMRGPDDHPLADDPPADPSLVSEPPKDEPPKDEPPADDPPKDEPPKDEPPKDDEPPVEPLKVEDLKLPEGFEMVPELGNKFVEVVNNAELSPQERANALLALHSETIQAAEETRSKAWDDMQTEWKDAVKADPDVGGAKMQPALTNIGKLINEFGDGELKGVFDLTGAGNNVHMIKFLDKIANVLTEGNFFKAGVPSSGNNSVEAKAARMFPTANKG
jgi:hypothetical protein